MKGLKISIDLDFRFSKWKRPRYVRFGKPDNFWRVDFGPLRFYLLGDM